MRMLVHAQLLRHASTAQLGDAPLGDAAFQGWPSPHGSQRAAFADSLDSSRAAQHARHDATGLLDACGLGACALGVASAVLPAAGADALEYARACFKVRTRMRACILHAARACMRACKQTSKSERAKERAPERPSPLRSA